MAKTDKFVEFIKEFGLHNLSAATLTSTATVLNWSERAYLPTVMNMYQIVKLSKGSISYSDIIDPYYAANPMLVG
jgi:hypothetical protein